MKLIVTTLLESVGGIFNVSIFLILVWLMFAILGINLYKQKMHYCKFNTPNTIDFSVYDYNKERCAEVKGAVWLNNDINFDNIISGMLTLFVLSTLEGWPSYML